MQRFLVRRALFIVISLFGATIVIFSMTRLAHDPRELFVPDTGYGMSEEQWEALGDKMGFNKPIPVQYLLWVGKLLRGDFGTSIHQELEVRDIIASKMGATIQLAVGGWVFAILVGVPLGSQLPPAGELYGTISAGGLRYSGRRCRSSGQALWRFSYSPFCSSGFLPAHVAMIRGLTSNTTYCPPSCLDGPPPPGSCGSPDRRCSRCWIRSS